MGSAKNLQPVLIGDGGVVVHYKDYTSRRRKPIPLCRVANWQTIDWDYDDGFGAKVCGRCQVRWDRLRAERIAKEKATYQARNRRYREQHGEELKLYMKRYREENRELYNKKMRIRYWQDPEKHRAWKRESVRRYRAKQKEQEGTTVVDPA
jgi:hypothetical protein